MINYDFVEIGTADFDTLIQDADDSTVGLSIEPLKIYLDNLPHKNNVTKVCAAVSPTGSSDPIDIYYIPPEIIENNNYSTWLKGCNKIGAVHPLSENLKSMVVTEKVRQITVSELYNEYDIHEIKYLKIDTEGYDCHILQEWLLFLEDKDTSYYPKKIMFESNTQTDLQFVYQTIEDFMDLGYNIRSLDYNTGATNTILEYNDAKISIILATYNHAKYLDTAIESALNQIHKNIELIVVDDGSIDNTSDIVAKYKDRLIYIKQENMGLAGARNTGITASTGEYIFFLDADDWIDPSYLSRLLYLIEDDYTIATSHHVVTDDNLQITQWAHSYVEDNPRSILLLNQTIVGASLFSKQRWIDIDGFDVKLNKGYEDLDFWARLVRSGCKIKFIDKTIRYPFFKYRKYKSNPTDLATANNLSSIASRNSAELLKYIKEKHLKENFYLPLTYNTNPVSDFNDINFTDKWQDEIYKYAKDIAVQNDYKTILDFGCGSAFKLIKYFNDYETIGIDLPQTVEILNKKYPDKIWKDDLVPTECDVLIASDVIEHMKNPNELLEFIEKCNPKEIILSTPDRNLIQNISKDGPPNNIHHIREWSFEEFARYIGDRFNIISHSISNTKQGTQLLHARK